MTSEAQSENTDQMSFTPIQDFSSPLSKHFKERLECHQEPQKEHIESSSESSSCTSTHSLKEDNFGSPNLQTLESLNEKALEAIIEEDDIAYALDCLH
jgi:hypothetical protein